MYSYRALKIAFLVSLATHILILSYNLNFNLFSQSKRKEKILVNYVKNIDKPPLEHPTKPTQSKKEPLLKISSKITLDKRNPPPFINKENVSNMNKKISLPKETLNKPSFIRPDIAVAKKKISLPELVIGKDKINNPSYISYYQIVREKIKRTAYQSYLRPETGEVYLSFIVANDGSLKEVRLIEDKSSASNYLKDTATKSLKNASPFPAFPKELDYPRLSFNVVISFEIE